MIGIGYAFGTGDRHNSPYTPQYAQPKKETAQPAGKAASFEDVLKGAIARLST